MRRVLKTSMVNRQAIYAAFAYEELNGRRWGGRSDLDRATLLRDERAAGIVQASYGTTPVGLMGALERCGDRPLKPDHYLDLFRIYDMRDAKKVHVLKYVGEITDEVIGVINTLSPVLLHPRVVSAVGDVSKAKQLTEAVACVQSLNSQASDRAIAEAIAQLDDKAALAAIVTRFIRRADRFPPQPLASDDEVRPLDTVAALMDAGKTYNNCLRSYIGRVLAGAVAFAEFRETMLLEFRPMSDGGWLLEDIHVANNGRVPECDRLAAREMCAGHGIPHLEAQRNTPVGWSSLDALLRRWEWVVD